MPGDDATCIVAKIRLPRKMILWAGPPEDPKIDQFITQKFLSFPGKKVLSGGTTGNIVSRYLGKPIDVDLNSMKEDIPR